MSNHILVAPSLLAADFSRLGEEISAVQDASWVHLDVMDGVFVPNISFGPPVISALRPVSQHFFDVHLMIEKPEQHVEAFVKSGADQITVHVEACTHLHRTIQQIRSHDIGAGVALNPHTPVSMVEWILPDVDFVLVMTVNPGFGGQAFIPRTLDKVIALRKIVKARGLRTRIGVDGGIGPDTAAQACAAGADVLIAGSSIFAESEPQAALRQLQQIVSQV